METGEGCLLRIFISEKDQHEGMPLYEWLVRTAQRQGVSGATVLRGLMGFGAHSQLHTAKVIRLSTDLPMIVEIVDRRERIEAFLEHVDPAIQEGLATLERAEVHFYRHASR